MVAVPRFVVAAPASGHGKTTVVTGLLAAYAARGLPVAGFKVGPDYIDPGYHALAHGRHPRNLDPVLQGEHRVAPLFLHGARTPRPADVAVVEGVMGLFDGRGTTAAGSTAHIAQLLGAPVVLVVDASAQGRSVAASVLGFKTYDPDVWLTGVILNRVGSDRHEQILRDALAGIGMPVLGALRRDDGVAVPSRHLGLVPAAEREGAARHAVDRLAALITEAVDLDAVVALARTAGPLSATPWDPASVIMTLLLPGQQQSHDHDRGPGGATGSGGARAAEGTGSSLRKGRAVAGEGAGSGTGRPVVAVAGGAAFTWIGFGRVFPTFGARMAESAPTLPLPSRSRKRPNERRPAKLRISERPPMSSARRIAMKALTSLASSSEKRASVTRVPQYSQRKSRHCLTSRA